MRTTKLNTTTQPNRTQPHNVTTKEMFCEHSFVWYYAHTKLAALISGNRTKLSTQPVQFLVQAPIVPYTKIRGLPLLLLSKPDVLNHLGLDECALLVFLEGDL